MGAYLWFSGTGIHASNNYGPWQYPEKLIPGLIQCALAGEAIPLYGSGEQVRDWPHVDDHVQALWLLLQQGEQGITIILVVTAL